jgi:nucleoside-diphosphate-sugar epimerase
VSRRVLVTGAAGFIGWRVCAALEAGGRAVLPFDSPGATVLDAGQLAHAMRACDGVVNLAGVLGTFELFGEQRRAVEVNVLGALNVFDAAAAAGVPVVQIGTGHKGQPNPYAITKGCAEDLALARAAQGQPITVVRAFHAYGPGQKACPPHGIGTVRKIIPSFVCRALTGIPLEVYGSGEQEIDLVHAEDVAEVLVGALDGPHGQVVEAGTGKATRVLDAARAVIEACGSSSPVVHLPMRPGEPERSRVVAGRGECAHPWPYRLAETIEHYREHLVRTGAFA